MTNEQIRNMASTILGGVIHRQVDCAGIITSSQNIDVIAGLLKEALAMQSGELEESYVNFVAGKIQGFAGDFSVYLEQKAKELREGE